MRLIITTNSNKMNILKNTKVLIPRRFMSLNELKDKLLGEFDFKSIYYIYKNYQYNLPFIFNIVKYLPYIDLKKEYKSNKLNELKLLKNDLLLNKYYSYDKLFLAYLKDCQIEFINLDDTLENQIILNILKENDIKYSIKNNQYLNKKYELKIAKTEEEEIYYVFSEINKLLKKGVLPEHINLVNVDSTYYPLLKRVSYIFKVDIALTKEASLIDKEELNTFLNNINNLLEALQNIKDEVLYKALVDIINKYDLTKINDINFLKDIIIYSIRNVKYPNLTYEHAIKIANLSDNFTNDDYVFILNFNQNFPHLLENDYLIDDELQELNLDTIKSLNNQIIKNHINDLHKVNNLVLSMPTLFNNENNFLSVLALELDIKEEKINLELGLNKMFDDILLTSYLDDLVNYNVDNENLNKYDITHLNYLGYDNKFKPFPLVIDDEIKVSYSSMKTYFLCSFYYYLDNILKLKVSEDTQASKLGTYVHHLLESSYNQDFNFESISKEAKKDFNKKEQFYASRFDEVVKRLIQFNKEHENESDLTTVERERKYEVKNDFLLVKGFIDKTLKQEDKDKITLAVIDYKTGQDKASLDNINYGFNMQLPIYLYLLYNTYKDKEIEICGLYLQKVTLDTLSLTEDVFSPFKLNGYTNLLYADKLDKSYMNTSYIANLKFKKDGSLSKTSKVLTNKDILEILDIVNSKLNEIKDAYINSDFKINPKVISNDVNACKYCPYSDICYHQYKDTIILENKSFNKGEETDEMDS